MTLFTIVLPFFVVFCLWLGYRILVKAGFDGRWSVVLLLPVINILMIWYFAFSAWPSTQPEHKSLD